MDPSEFDIFRIPLKSTEDIEKAVFLLPLRTDETESATFLLPRIGADEQLIGVFAINGNQGFVGEGLEPGEFGSCAFTITLPSNCISARLKAKSGAWCSFDPNRWRAGIGVITKIQSSVLGDEWYKPNNYYLTSAEAAAAWLGAGLVIDLGSDKKLGWYVRYDAVNNPTSDNIYFYIYGVV